MTWTQFPILIIGILAVFRATLLFYKEKGPFSLFERLRCRLDKSTTKFNVGPEGTVVRFFCGLFSCFWCLSIWVALAVTVFAGPRYPVGFVLFWLALSGGAILLWEVIDNGEG